MNTNTSISYNNIFKDKLYLEPVGGRLPHGMWFQVRIYFRVYKMLIGKQTTQMHGFCHKVWSHLFRVSKNILAFEKKIFEEFFIG